MWGVRTYTIGEVADRSGFSASALRYYEGIGLVRPAARTESGYRLYDDRSVDQLAFIARAKRLGCTLEEIVDLVEVWDGDRCVPVQRRFHDLVTGKLAETRRQVAELRTLTRQLEAAAGQLAGPAVDGPCDDGCACIASAAGPNLPVEPPAIACSLDGDDVADRLATWQHLLGTARSRDAGPGGSLRIEFDGLESFGEVARLVAAEQRCCAFLAFTITVDHIGVTLEVSAPEGAEAALESIFGAPA